MSQTPEGAPLGTPPATSGQPPPTARPPAPWSSVRPTNTKAILAVALLSIAPAAIVFGVLARQEIKRTGEGGWGLATAGMIIGIVVVASYLLFVVAYVAVAVIAIIGGHVLTQGAFAP